MNEASVTRVVEQIGAPLPPKGPKLARKARVLAPPATEDPILELRRLTRQHLGWTRKKVAMLQMVSDRTNRDTGETIKSDAPEDVRLDVARACETWDAALTLLEREMRRALKQVPIYTVWLKDVYGLKSSAVIASYLIADIDIYKAVKVSNLRRFCGLAVINGRLERRTKGLKNAYNSALRTRLYQFFTTLRRNAAGREGGREQRTCKYLDVWNDYKHRMQHSVRVDVEANTIDGKKGARSKIDSTGWHKAADVFIEDLYIVWRALEGLPVWPSYQAAKLGYEHGGKICVNAPKMLSVADAIRLVGDVGVRPVGPAVE